MPPDLVTSAMFKGKRPPEFGPVTITFEEVLHVQGKFDRPTSVSGIVYPCGTSGRDNAPEPSSGLRVSMAKRIQSRYKYDSKTGRNYNNQGIIDMEKGHIMGLQLGGPDIPQNIAPQWAKWQGCGEWSQMENRVRELAEKGKDKYHVLFHCSIGYFNSVPLGRTGLHGTGKKRLCTPNHFTVTVEKQDIKTGKIFDKTIMYNGSPRQNDADDLAALQKMLPVDGWPPYSDVVRRQTLDKNGKPVDKMTFGPSGQDPLYRGEKRRRVSTQDSAPSVVYSTTRSQDTQGDRSRRSARQADLNAKNAREAKRFRDLDLNSDDDLDGDFVPTQSSESSDMK